MTDDLYEKAVSAGKAYEARIAELEGALRNCREWLLSTANPSLRKIIESSPRFSTINSILTGGKADD